MTDQPRSSVFDLDEPTIPDPDADPLRSGFASLVWALALTAFCIAPAVVIAAWRWFL